MGKLEEHDNELRRLARDPAEAMRRWAKLAETDRITVITYMAGYYDIKFARMFLHETKLRKRPDLSVLVTNDRSVTSDSLKARGYRKFSDAGGVLVWVHPPARRCGCFRRRRRCRLHHRRPIRNRKTRHAGSRTRMSRKRARPWSSMRSGNRNSTSARHDHVARSF